MSSGYYDNFEAAKLLGTSATTIRSWASRGILPRGRFIGGRLRWTKSQLIAARDSVAGVAVTPSPTAMAIIEAHCGCGAMARAIPPGPDGFVLIQCPQCSATMAVQTATQFVYRRDIDANEIAPSRDPEAVLGSKAAMIHVDRSPGKPMVYFIRLGAYVKIGTSTDVRGRIGALSLAPGNLLAVRDGSYKLEHEMHQRFAALRAFKEWFYLQDALLDYVRELQRGHIQRLVDEAS